MSARHKRAGAPHERLQAAAKRARSAPIAMRRAGHLAGAYYDLRAFCRPWPPLAGRLMPRALAPMRAARACIYCRSQPNDPAPCPCSHSPCVHDAVRAGRAMADGVAAGIVTQTRDFHVATLTIPAGVRIHASLDGGRHVRTIGGAS